MSTQYNAGDKAILFNPESNTIPSLHTAAHLSTLIALYNSNTIITIKGKVTDDSVFYWATTPNNDTICIHQNHIRVFNVLPLATPQPDDFIGIPTKSKLTCIKPGKIINPNPILYGTCSRCEAQYSATQSDLTPINNPQECTTEYVANCETKFCNNSISFH